MGKIVDALKAVSAKLDGYKTYLVGYSKIAAGMLSMFGFFTPADATELVTQLAVLIGQLAGVGFTLAGLATIFGRMAVKKLAK
jgi:hypothetical protein